MRVGYDGKSYCINIYLLDGVNFVVLYISVYLFCWVILKVLIVMDWDGGFVVYWLIELRLYLSFYVFLWGWVCGGMLVGIYVVDRGWIIFLGDGVSIVGE